MKFPYKLIDSSSKIPFRALAGSKKRAIKKYYEEEIKNFGKDVSYFFRSGKIFNEETKRKFVYNISMHHKYPEEVVITLMSIYSGDEEESDRIWIEDAWIPKTIMKKLKYASPSVHSYTTFADNSIFLLDVEIDAEKDERTGTRKRNFAYNPHTKCLMVSNDIIENYFFKEHVIDIEKNPEKDFVFFNIGSYYDRKNGYVFLYDSKFTEIKDQNKSYKITETLRMLKKNGIKDKTIIAFPGSTRWTYDYFMKAKVIW